MPLTPGRGWPYMGRGALPLRGIEDTALAADADVSELFARVAALEAGLATAQADAAAWKPIAPVVKPISTPRTNNSILADPHLVITIPAGQTWDLLYVLYLAGGAGDWQGNLSWTNTAIVSYGHVGAALAYTVNDGGDGSFGPTTRQATVSPGLNMLCGTIAAGASEYLWAQVIADPGAAVTVTLNWGQQTTNATQTQLLNGSRIQPRRAA